VHVSGEDPRQEHLLLLPRAVHLQRRADGLQGDRGQRDVGPRRLVGEDLLLDLAEPPSAVLLGPAHPHPAVATHALHHVAVDLAVALDEEKVAFLGGHERLEVRAQLVAQRLLLLGQLQLHVSPSPGRVR
jgi:hypothetical protein